MTTEILNNFMGKRCSSLNEGFKLAPFYFIWLATTIRLQMSHTTVAMRQYGTLRVKQQIANSIQFLILPKREEHEFGIVVIGWTFAETLYNVNRVERKMC